MNKNIFTIVVIGFMTFSSCTQMKESYFETEVSKWKKELYDNGEVGKPCREDNDWEKWMEDNPNYYYGMQEIQSYESDFNNDNIKDRLFYFPAQNCVGGNGFDSDFGMLVYSNNEEFLTNKKITSTIEQKIKGELADLGIYSVNLIIIRYKGLDNSIYGEYSTWLESDANCCPSYKGTFNYYPIDFSMKIENKSKNGDFIEKDKKEEPKTKYYSDSKYINPKNSFLESVIITNFGMNAFPFGENTVQEFKNAIAETVMSNGKSPIIEGWTNSDNSYTLHVNYQGENVQFIFIHLINEDEKFCEMYGKIGEERIDGVQMYQLVPSLIK